MLQLGWVATLQVRWMTLIIYASLQCTNDEVYRYNCVCSAQSNDFLEGCIRSFNHTCKIIGIDTKIEVIVVSPIPRSLVTPQWPKSRYQFLFYHDASKHSKSMEFRVCKIRKSLIKLLQISHYGKHGHRPLSQQLPYLRLGNQSDVTVMPVSLNSNNIPHWKTSRSTKMFV